MRYILLILMMCSNLMAQSLSLNSLVDSIKAEVNLNVAFIPGASACYSTQFDLALPSSIALISQTRGPDLPATFDFATNPNNKRTVLVDRSGGTIPLHRGIIEVCRVKINVCSDCLIPFSNIISSNAMGSSAVFVSFIPSYITVSTIPELTNIE